MRVRRRKKLKHLSRSRVLPFIRSGVRRSADRSVARVIGHANKSFVELPRFPYSPPTLSALPALFPVLPNRGEMAIKQPRTRVMSGGALSRPALAPTADLARLRYVRSDVMVCVRRNQRRQVLAALGKLGGGHKKPRYTSDSYIIC